MFKIIQKLSLVVLVITIGVLTFQHFVSIPALIELIKRKFAWDYAINWTAAQGMLRNISLYDKTALSTLGVELIGPKMQGLFSEINTFTGYIGPPTTALLLLPFTFFPFDTSLFLYRSVILVAFLLTVFVSGLSLPSEDRRLGWFVGVLALVTMRPLMQSVSLGQVDAWVALSLAFSVLLARHNRWFWSGIGVGVAILLKISPGLVIVYCLLCKEWRLPLSACLTVVIGLLVAGGLGQWNDIWIFFSNVLPAVSQGSIGIDNQSLTGWLARLVLPSNNILDFGITLGSFRIVSILIGGILLYIILRMGKANAPNYIGIIACVLAGLLTGPVTWGHYTSWILVCIPQIAHHDFWRKNTNRTNIAIIFFMVVGGILFILPLRCLPDSYFSSEYLVLHSWVRWTTGVWTVAVLIWFGVAVRLLSFVSNTSLLGTRKENVLKPRLSMRTVAKQSPENQGRKRETTEE